MWSIREIANKKQRRVRVGRGKPLPREGVNGEFRLNMSNNGVKLYAKYKGEWITFVPERKQENEVDLNQTISSIPTQSQVQAISNKVDNILVKLRLAGIIKERNKD
tara:strand:- start:289 stop:606 length:318 start_codon:yes stop_codon:yes gene_type:complete